MNKEKEIRSGIETLSGKKVFVHSVLIGPMCECKRVLYYLIERDNGKLYQVTTDTVILDQKNIKTLLTLIIT